MAGQEEDTGARGLQQDNCKHQEDKRRTQRARGQLQAPGGQEEDKTWTQRSGAWQATMASCFSTEKENPIGETCYKYTKLLVQQAVIQQL